MKFFSNNNVVQRKIFQSSFLALSKLSFKSWNVMFFGSDRFSLGSLRVLYRLKNEKLITNLEVVTKNESCPVFQYAESKNIKVQFWPPLLSNNYHFGVVVSFGKIIPQKIIDFFPYGIINVHPSLLPRWRGGMPIVHAIKNGDSMTGITIIRINSAVDAGDIIMQKPVPVGEHEMLPSLYNKLNKIGAECLLEVIQQMPKCLDNIKPQSNEGIMKAPILDKSVSLVQWNSMTAMAIYNLYRSFSDIFPLWSTWKGQKIWFLCLSPSHDMGQDMGSVTGEEKIPGTFIYNKKIKRIVVYTTDKSVHICTVKFKGKIKTAQNFFTGYLGGLPKEEWKFGS